MTLRIYTVYKSGGVYHEGHIERLAKQVKDYSGIDLDCLFEPRFPGWWSKMDLYNEEGPILYMDLDTTIVGSLDPLLDAATKYDFVGLSPFRRAPRHARLYKERFGKPGVHSGPISTGLTAWKGSAVKHLIEIFEKSPEAYMSKFRGDDLFVREFYEGQETFWQNLGDYVSSYKIDVKGKTEIRPDCRVVCYHGLPKPWDIDSKTGKSFDDEVRSKK